jgi:hypothetical protein
MYSGISESVKTSVTVEVNAGAIRHDNRLTKSLYPAGSLARYPPSLVSLHRFSSQNFADCASFPAFAFSTSPDGPFLQKQTMPAES